MNVTEVGIYGMGSNKLYRVRKAVDFDYNQIDRVNNLDNHVLIDVGADTYAFAIDNAAQLTDNIKKLHEDYRAKRN